MRRKRLPLVVCLGVAITVLFGRFGDLPVFAQTPLGVTIELPPEDAAGGTPEALDDEASALIEGIPEIELKNARSWRAPEYGRQNGVLGWSEGVFDPPAGLRGRVDFWKDIYSKYTTDQGVIHDSTHIGIVYGSVDFGPIMKDSTKNIYQKNRLRVALIRGKKKEIIERLRRLHGRRTADGLDGEDLRVWRMFEHVNEPDKFRKATGRNRVRFQLGQKDKFILGIYHSGRYLREMERIFREQGLPIELTRLPFVESSFNIHARSRVGASGVWQFMPRTARPYMKVNKEIDERNDPIRSTIASARVLKQNYQMLRTWPLAVTGYNHGPYGVRGIVNKLGTRDLAEIISRYSSRTFGFASENFYACFLAALEVERDARKLFGDVKWSAEIDSAELRVMRSMSFRNLVDFFDGDDDFAKLLNPHFLARIRSDQRPVPAGTFIRVPAARAKLAEDFMGGKIAPNHLALALHEVPLLKPELASMDVGVASAATVESTPPQIAPVVSPVPSVVTASVPPVSNQKKIVLEAPPPPPVPAPPESSPASFPASSQEVLSEIPSPTAKSRTHRVRKGDNLTRIAHQYGIDLPELRKANGFDQRTGKKRSQIRIGQVLVIPPEIKSSRGPQSEAPPAQSEILVPGETPVVDHGIPSDTNGERNP